MMATLFFPVWLHSSCFFPRFNPCRVGLLSTGHPKMALAFVEIRHATQGLFADLTSYNGHGFLTKIPDGGQGVK